MCPLLTAGEAQALQFLLSITSLINQEESNNKPEQKPLYTRLYGLKTIPISCFI